MGHFVDRIKEKNTVLHEISRESLGLISKKYIVGVRLSDTREPKLSVLNLDLD